jgi:hypothetical protein
MDVYLVIRNEGDDIDVYASLDLAQAALAQLDDDAYRLTEPVLTEVLPYGMSD